MKVTLKEIAKELGIAPATVSRALSNHPEISDSTKKKVKAAAKRMGYRTNQIASSLRSGITNNIGVLIPNAEHWFFGSVINGISNLASKKGYNVLIYQSNETEEFERKGIETFIDARVDGIIVSVSKRTTNYAHFDNARKLMVPIVFFDRIYDSVQFSSVTIDDQLGGFLATESLIRSGYKRIAHTTGPLYVKAFSERLKGYKNALEHYHIDFDEKLVFNGECSVASGQMGVQYYMGLEHKPDAIFAVEDFTALGTLKELKKLSIKVPDEMGVFGFCNDPFGDYLSPSLSSVDQKTIQMGEEAFNLLYESLHNTSGRTNIQRRILIPELIERESSKKPM
jgi:LacI family transcriptional regulator